MTDGKNAENGNEGTVAVISNRKVGVTERKQVEHLIDERRGDLLGMVQHLNGDADVYAESIDFTAQDELDANQKKLIVVNESLDKAQAKADSEWTSLKMVLDEEERKYLGRLDRQKKQWMDKHVEKLTAVKEDHDTSHEKKLDKLSKQKADLTLSVQKLDAKKSQEVKIRKMIAGRRLELLKDVIRDNAHKAKSLLWTGNGVNVCGEALDHLPNQTDFRQGLSSLTLVSAPEMATLLASERVCKFCKDNDNVEISRGRSYCRNCGKHDVFDNEHNIISLSRDLSVIAKSGGAFKQLLDKSTDNNNGTGSEG